VHHALQGVDAGHPLYLLGIEDPFTSCSMCLQDQEVPPPPPRYELKLSAQLHPRPLEDLSGREPFISIIVDTAKALIHSIS
jgi:hypothetical protein